jgi:poly(hydroxyalkanoate) depolymerase family esterase
MSENMAEATRLTKLGRLQEAMAVLRGEAWGDRATDETPPADAPGYIDMVQENGPGTSWKAAPAEEESKPDAPKHGLKLKLEGLAELVRLHKGFKGGGPLRTPSHKPLPDGASFSTLAFSNAAGSRQYKLYVPSTHRAGSALIVMLHGCTQSPDDFAAGTQMNDLAETHGFLVAYPAQPKSANMNGCWNWFNTTDQQRDMGEPSIIAGLTRAIMAQYSVNPKSVFVAGLSAGGAMAAIMGAVYSELYAAVGVHSGLPVGSAHDMPSAFAAMGNGGRSSAVVSSSVPMIVFHGDADRTVNVSNGEEIISLAARSGSLTRRGEIRHSAGGLDYTLTHYDNGAGVIMAEHWLLHGGGHAWSGGDGAGSYADPRGPNASQEMIRFFMKAVDQ